MWWLRSLQRAGELQLYLEVITMEEGKWAEQKASEVRRKKGKDESYKQISLLEDEELRAEAPALWQEFVVAVRQRANAFNKALGEDALELWSEHQKEIIIRINDGVTKIIAEFVPERLHVHCYFVSTSFGYTMTIIKGSPRFVRESASHGTGFAMTPDEAAEQFLNSTIADLAVDAVRQALTT